MSAQNKRKLIFENPKLQSSDLPCSFKERYEAFAVEKLLQCDGSESNSLQTEDCANFFRISWPVKKERGSSKMSKAQSQENEKDLGTLLYEAMKYNDDESELQAFSKGGISPWEPCDSQKGHNGGYLSEQHTWKPPSCTSRSSSRKHFDRKRLALSLGKQPFSIQNGARKCDHFEERPSEKSSEKDEGSSRSSSQIKSAPPHCDLKFRRFQNPRDYIIHYLDNITYLMINQHLYRYMNHWQACKSFKKPQQKQETQPSVEDKKSCTQIFRLQLNEEGAQGQFGVLRVGPCPGTETLTSLKKANKIEVSREVVTTYKQVIKTFETPKKTTLQITITGAKPPSCENGSNGEYEFISAQKKLTKPAKKTLIIPKASSIEFSKSGNVEKEDLNGNSKGWNDKIKTVELQIVKAATTSSAYGTRKKTTAKLNRPKNKPTPPPSSKSNKTSPAHNACQPSIVYGSNMTKMIFADKQFLRITTPKPIGVNPASKQGSMSKLFNPQDDSIYPWAETLSVIPRGRVIDEAQLLHPYLHESVQYPDKRFQACITPISYPSSSIDVQIHKRSVDISPLNHCKSDEDLMKTSSKSTNVPKADSFVKM